MYTFEEIDHQALKHIESYVEICSLLAAKLTATDENLILNAQSCLFADQSENEDLYKIIEGQVSLCINNIPVIIFEPEDLIGNWLVDNQSLELKTDFAVKTIKYSKKEFDQKISKEPDFSNLWFKALSHYIKFITYCYATASKDCEQPTPEILSFKAGDVIIKEGDLGDTVFTLLSGKAVASVNNIQVGKINENEIFGAIGPLTDKKRTATVTADTPCTVASLKKDNFELLFASRPQTVLKLIKEMAEKIVNLNRKIVEFNQK
ncbi:MAG: cyclic nucleotide-binding domain-containing protein [Bdellovibrionales bacterium]|nr:cyclic nucleotide-binding domain-containing protein [Bdellovibrionales bacterium]